jgi:hypothetical protein
MRKPVTYSRPAEGQVARGEHKALADADLVLVPMEDAKV